MSYLKIKKQIEQSKISPVYFFYGTQTFLMEDLIQSIIKHTVGQADDPNIITYNLQETLLDLVIEEVETVPFFGDKKVVIVKDFILPTSQKQNDKLDHDLKKLEQYIENPASESILIIVCPYEKLDTRKKVTKMLNKHASVVECAPFDDRMMDEWLAGQAQERGFIFSKDGKERLLLRVGPQLQLLASEMEKLALFMDGKEEEVTGEIIDLLVARTLEQDVFALIDFAIGRNLEKALLIYHDLMKQKEEPIKLLSLIVRQLRIYYQVKELTSRSYSQKQIASQLKIHPYVVKLASGQINRMDEKKLFSLLQTAAETDYAIKIGKIDKVLAVELLLMKLTALRK